MPRSSSLKNIMQHLRFLAVSLPFKLYQSLRPFAELIRLDKPVGTISIFFPYFYGFAFALLTSWPRSTFSAFFPGRLLLLIFSTFILRSMGCAWNDIVDMDVDPLVERTKNRPMARRAISLPLAYCFTAGLLVVWTASVTQLVPQSINLGSYAIPLTVLVMAYPYAKRFTNHAQVLLGITVGFGVIFGAAMGGIDILHMASQAVLDAAQATDPKPLSDILANPQISGLLLLYGACLVWNIITDTVYAFQDVRDDKKLGLRSTAVRYMTQAKSVMSLLAVLQVILLAKLATLMNGISWLFMVSAVAGNAVTLACLVVSVDLNDPKSCGWWFKMASLWIGSTIGVGFTLQYMWEMLAV